MSSAKYQATWKLLKAQGKSPLGRSSHSFSIINRKVYILGGENTPRVPIDSQLNVLGLEEGRWHEYEVLGQPPCARIAHASAAIGDHLYVFGGRTGIAMGEGALNDMYLFDTKTRTWSELHTKGDLPLASSYHAMTSADGKIYLFGGCVTDSRLNDLHVFDPRMLTWKKLPTYDAIAGRGGPGLAVVGNSLYVISGFAGHETNDMYCFDLKKNTWKTITPEINFTPRSVFGTAVLGQKILIFGGELAPSDLGHAGAGAFTNEAYCFDTLSPHQGWQKVEAEGEVPGPRGWMPVSAASESEIVVFGGNTESNERLGDTYLMTLK